LPFLPSLPAHVRVLVHRHAHVVARLVLDEVGRALQSLAESNGVLSGADAAVQVLESTLVLLDNSVNLDLLGLLLHLNLWHCVGPASKRYGQLPLEFEVEVGLQLLLPRRDPLVDEALSLLVVELLNLLADLGHVDLLLSYALGL
jgi:hypothetical protein